MARLPEHIGAVGVDRAHIERWMTDIHFAVDVLAVHPRTINAGRQVAGGDCLGHQFLENRVLCGVLVFANF